MYYIIRRKYLAFVLSAAAVLFFAAVLTFRAHQTNFTSISYKTIVIDPGHGGVDTGTHYGNIYEKDINLAVALKLKNLLVDNGYKVIMTRETDTALDKFNKTSSSRHRRDLNQRVDTINNSNCEFFISIHVNSNPGSKASGPIVIYSRKYPESKALASSLQSVLNSIGYSNYNPPDHLETHGHFYIFGYSDKPGTIVELGFITNPTDRTMLLNPDYQSYIAGKIYEGTAAYYSKN